MEGHAEEPAHIRHPDLVALHELCITVGHGDGLILQAQIQHRHPERLVRPPVNTLPGAPQLLLGIHPYGRAVRLHTLYLPAQVGIRGQDAAGLPAVEPRAVFVLRRSPGGAQGHGRPLEHAHALDAVLAVCLVVDHILRTKQRHLAADRVGEYIPEIADIIENRRYIVRRQRDQLLRPAAPGIPHDTCIGIAPQQLVAHHQPLVVEGAHGLVGPAPQHRLERMIRQPLLSGLIHGVHRKHRHRRAQDLHAPVDR